MKQPHSRKRPTYVSERARSFSLQPLLQNIRKEKKEVYQGGGVNTEPGVTNPCDIIKG